MSNLDRAIDKRIRKGLATMRPGAIPKSSIGAGAARNGARPASLNAQRVKVNLTNVDLQNIDVPHTLNGVPTMCQLIGIENAGTPDAHATLRPVSQDKWTRSTARVALHFVNGDQSGSIAEFMVWGE